MSLVEALPRGAIVGIDTAPVIYLVEAHPRYGPVVLPLFAERLEPGVNLGVTSVVTLAEVLVKPLLAARRDLVLRYRDFLSRAPHFTIADITAAAAERAADLRARHGIRLPDALQVATAMEHGASHFVTNDARLRVVADVTVVVLDDYLGGATG